ncbi:hypothetical protein PputGB1_1738 [Pseudomonas putida GB-1]|uniref:Uncharacterized protein n=1 Tax=Pseudomonas putida (strain GB-1) TaxID=76869 RepID=B0KHD6_PSEPG|nr:hypothetical protein PputGB1_1738 [Pseudomonas putida GB-1]
MNYQPQSRPVHGFQPFTRASMSTICDVCGTPRNKGNHQLCSEARKAAGFVYQGVK